MSIPIQVAPPTNNFTLSKDETFAEVVKVTIPKSGVVPKVDVYFLADTTGSMAPAIAAVKSGMVDILNRTQALGSDVQFGVGNYKDFPAPDASYHPYAFDHQCNLSANIAEVKAAVDTWTTTRGRDVPEAQFYGLDQVAEPPGGKIGWRSDAKRIIVWIGDAGGHDPVCKAITGLSYDITEASVTEKLVAEKISVLAMSLNTPDTPAGLDNAIERVSDWYQNNCGTSGQQGQGTRIANATGGTLVPGVRPDTVVKRIEDELATQIASIRNVRLVASGATAQFVQAIAPSAGYGPLSRDQDHELSFDVSWIGTVEATSEVQVFNGSLDVIADAEVVGGKTVQITVEAIIVRPPDRSGTWMLIHEVTGNYFVVEGFNPSPNLAIRIWPQDPPGRVNGPQQGHLWVLVRENDGTYLIQTQQHNAPNQFLYLQAPAQPGPRAYPRLHPRNETNDFQSWVLVPVTSDPDTYAIQSKRFPGHTLGLDNGDCNGVGYVVLSNSWGRPTLHKCWRLSHLPIVPLA
jgi:hypothetical protein